MIHIEKPTQDKLEKLKVETWPIWEKEVSQFPWTYSDKESCFILEGEVIVTPENGNPVKIEAGDFVIFPAGMNCHWDIKKAIKKHYEFG